MPVEDFLPDYLDEFFEDQDSSLGIPDEFSQRVMLSKAVARAHQVDSELREQVPGVLAEYVRHALEEAATAAAELLVTHPEDDRAIFELQKRTAPYAGVMAWIRHSIAIGQTSQIELSEMNENQDLDDDRQIN